MNLLSRVFILFSCSTFISIAADRDTMVRSDRTNVVASGKWVYNDLARGIDEAKRTGKPMLVVVRCIPCVACQGFDARVLNYDPAIQDLMDKFVTVRIVQANGMDLSLFAHDYDLSFAAYFLNPDKTIYGRFGSRSNHDQAEKDISIEGFRKAMLAALELHRNFPADKASLVGKKGEAPRFSVPEEFPSLKTKYTSKLNYESKVAGTCIHCHQVREAERLVFRTASEPIPDKLLFPWPMPDVIGLSLDPTEKAKVQKVASNSAAAKAGFRAGDEILFLEGQPMLSIADVQWVLNNAGTSASLKAEVQRGSERLPLTLNLDKDWRRKSDISWRPTSWDFRRMFTGGMLLKDTTPAERQKLNLTDADLALRADYIPQGGGEHATAKKAGFLKNDVILNIDGKNNHMTESDLFGHLAQNRMRGTRVPVTVLRGGNKVDLELPMQ